MGRADSPLRDRVVFVDGAPRSGTTWLVTLMAAHPDVAGVAAESHLFDFGVDRLFDNFEGRHPTLHGLQSFVDREELVDLARDLCDGVLLAMRSHVSGTTLPGFVVEKTPVGARADGLELQRKRECYPDGWFLHIVREREAVVRSLMGAPFMADRSREACGALWDRVVEDVRGTLGDSPRYLELRYEDLRADPLAACRTVFDWLGVATTDATEELLRGVARERVSELGTAAPSPKSRAATLNTGVRDAFARLRRRGGPAAPDPLAFTFTAALRERDREALGMLAHEKFELVHRSAEGDRWLEGDPAREALGGLADEVFGRRYISEWWASSGAGPGEWWTTTPGRPFVGIFCSALGGDATRVDVAFGLLVEDGLVRRLVVISAGPVSGRPVRSGD